MEYVSGLSKAKPVPPEITQTPYWAPYHITKGLGERTLYGASLSFADIASELPEQYDGFTIGMHLAIKNQMADTPNHTAAVPSGQFYFPQDRCEFVPLRVLEEASPKLFLTILSLGQTSALQTRNGFIGYNPKTMHIVK